MPFKKGHIKVEGSGVKKGQKTKKTLEREEFQRRFMEVGLPRILDIIEAADDETAAPLIIAVMPYSIPKLSSVESTGTHNIVLDMKEMSQVDLDRYAGDSPIAK